MVRHGFVVGLIALWLGFGSGACDCGYPEIFYDDLQTRCGGMPCGWDLVAGSAHLVRTFHSDAQGLALNGGAVVHRALPDVAIGRGEALRLHALVACTAETTLGLAIEGESVDTPSQWVILLGATGQGAGATVPFPRAEVILEVSEEEAPNPAFVGRQLRLWADGAGTCTIDEIRLLRLEPRRCDG